MLNTIIITLIAENKNASADFFVDSKQIIQTVDSDVNYSWHCGDGYGKYGITIKIHLGIEICIEKDGNPTEQLYNQH